MRLAGKVAIVTGAARGIGQSFALCLIREGAKVVAADILDTADTVAQGTALGGDITGVTVDVTRGTSTQAMAQAAVDRYGRIDVLVNNAGLWAGLKAVPIDVMEEDVWDRVFAVNVKGVWLCCKAVFPHMRRQHSGSIINIGSCSTLAGVPYLGHYVASKGAVWAFTRSLAREAGEFNIRVNTISPGLTATPAARTQQDAAATDAIFEMNRAARCLHRDQQPEDLNGALVFLAADESAFMTGQNLAVEGGCNFY